MTSEVVALPFRIQHYVLYKQRLHTMKKISLLIIAILALAGCTKSQVCEANILGTWGESYDTTKFAFDGVLRYTFDDGNTYSLYTSNPDGSSQNTITGNYVLASKGNYLQKFTGGVTITLNQENSDDSNATYVIVKLTSDEMAWQKVGTTYSEGTWGSDYRHFVRVK